jgi:hypothetical protein
VIAAAGLPLDHRDGWQGVGTTITAGISRGPVAM